MASYNYWSDIRVLRRYSHCTKAELTTVKNKLRNLALTGVIPVELWLLYNKYLLFCFYSARDYQDVSSYNARIKSEKKLEDEISDFRNKTNTFVSLHLLLND